jgi:hypothetical protein
LIGKDIKVKMSDGSGLSAEKSVSVQVSDTTMLSKDIMPAKKYIPDLYLLNAQTLFLCHLK